MHRGGQRGCRRTKNRPTGVGLSSCNDLSVSYIGIIAAFLRRFLPPFFFFFLRPPAFFLRRPAFFVAAFFLRLAATLVFFIFAFLAMVKILPVRSDTSLSIYKKMQISSFASDFIRLHPPRETRHAHQIALRDACMEVHMLTWDAPCRGCISIPPASPR